MSGIAALGPVLTQLTGVITSLTNVLSSQVGGASGGGAAAAPAQPAAPTPAAPAPAANAATGAAAVQGGGGATNVDNAALVSALTGVIQAITALVAALQSQVGGVSGGGAPGKTPTQTPPGKTPVQQTTQVAGASGSGAAAAPQKTAPPKGVPTPPATPTQVAGANGGAAPTKAPAKAPDKAPAKITPPPVVPAPPTQVGGANGGPVQQSPTQSPLQSPVQTPIHAGGPTGPVQGDVKLYDKDYGAIARLEAGAGMTAGGDFVELSGDPHVSVKINGVAKNYDIGYGPGTVTLKDGTKISWDTYGSKPRNTAIHSEFHLATFNIDSAGTEFDRGVKTNDGTDTAGLTTALTHAQLIEFESVLQTYAGSTTAPLKQTLPVTQTKS